jgi:outer membrane receptor protein involved in Fe transport
MRRPFVVFVWFFLPAFFFGQASQAQQHDQSAASNTKISGRVLDSTSHQPIEYATITVFAKKGSRPVSGGMTNNKGSFQLEGLPPGTYSLTVEVIGYQSRNYASITLGSATAAYPIGDILLGKKAADLQAVTVTAPRGLVENKLDKMVYNAEKDITSQGGVATDILRKVPMVSVDVDGNVQLLGNSNILFLINGRPSSIFGNSLADALQTIPASQIKSIEVITSPGAKYDAEGTGGIINIVLKDNKINGINGNASLTAGTRLENGNFNFNARHGDFGINAFFGGNTQLPSTTRYSSTRQSFDSAGNASSILSQDGSSRFTRGGYHSGLGFDWNLDKKNNLAGGIGYDNFGNNSEGSYQQTETLPTTPGAPPFNSLVNSNSHFRGSSFDWNLRYKKTFAQEDRELNISADGSYGTNRSSYGQAQSLPAGDSTFAGSQGNNNGRDLETNLRLDYVQPFGEKVRLETGGRIQLRQINSTSPVYAFNPSGGDFLFDSSQSNALNYGRHVYAGYTSLTFPAFHFLDIKSGLRYERTETDAGFSKAPDTHIPGYNTFVPSFVISHSFDEQQSIKLSYAKRIQRPDYRSLNPYVNASDPKNLSQGNPLLQPEIGNNFDLTYTKSFDKGSALNIVLFYHHNSQDIQPFIKYYPQYTLGDSVYTNVSVSTPMNVGFENNFGMNAFGSVPIGKKLNLRGNLSTFYRYINAGILGSLPIHSFNYRINLNATYQVSNTFVLEFFGNFNSARNEVQGKYPSFTSYNFAARKQFWNKKASIAFTTTNPLGEYVNQATEVSGANFMLNSLRQVPFRSFGLNFTYKFGKLEFKKDKEENKEAPALPETGG